MTAPAGVRSVGLLTAADAAATAGLALAQGLRRTGRAPVALLLVADRRADAGDAAGSVPAGTAARRLAASLTARDVPARTAGRIVVVALDPDAAVARAQAQRAAAAAADAPLVVAVGGPCDEGAAGLLAVTEARVVLLASRDPEALARLAADSGATVVRSDIGAADRFLAARGLPTSAPLRRLGAELGRAR